MRGVEIYQRPKKYILPVCIEWKTDPLLWYRLTTTIASGSHPFIIPPMSFVMCTIISSLQHDLNLVLDT